MEEGGALGVGFCEGFALEGGDCWGRRWRWCAGGREECDGVVEVREGGVCVLEEGGGVGSLVVGRVRGMRGWLDEDGVAVPQTDELGAVVVGGGVSWVGGYEGCEGVVGGFEDGGGEVRLGFDGGDDLLFVVLEGFEEVGVADVGV